MKKEVIYFHPGLIYNRPVLNAVNGRAQIFQMSTGTLSLVYI